MNGRYEFGTVIVEHILADGQTWYSVYRHLGQIDVNVSDTLQVGQQLGSIADWQQAGENRSHLHFEIRNFYISNRVNGANSASTNHRNFPPGPGYWPVGTARGSGEHPIDKGWVNPTQFIEARRAETQQAQQDRYETDDTFDRATSINTDGSQQTHSIHRPGDEDWVKFSATSGRRYIIETLNLTGGADTFIGLFWNNGGHPWLIESNDDGNPDYASRIEWSATDSGTFYVKIRNYDENYGSENTTYDVRITAVEGSQTSGNTSNHSNNRSGSVNSNALNVRTGPGTGYPVLGQLTRNRTVNLTARNSNSSWYQIDFEAGPEGFGWVSANFIVTSASGLPVSDRVSSAPANIAPASNPAPTSNSHQSQVAGNMNMGRYCQAKGFDEAALAEHTAYGWYCSSGNGNRSGMDLEELCRQQHGSGYRPEHTNFSDPYSWRCVATNSAPAPAQPQPAQPAPPPQAPPRRTATHYQVSSQEWRCGDSGIIAIGLTPDGERRLRVSLIKCPTTQHAGKFGSSGHYFVRVDGVRVWRFNYSRDHSMFVEYIDPIERGYSGFHSYQIELYPDGQQEPILSGAISAHDVQVEE